MVRDKLKSAARRAAIKFFKMEFDTEARAPRPAAPDPADFDPSKIPKIVDGDGDTPGPNHKEDVGRPWLSAQLASDIPCCIIDIRTPSEAVGGMLPTALLLPGNSLKENLDKLPDKGLRITICDQTGSAEASALASWLRDEGWTLARCLRGGFAEWLTHGEPTESPKPVAKAKCQVGDPIKLKDGRSGEVQSVTKSGKTIKYFVWLSDGTSEGPLGADALDC